MFRIIYGRGGRGLNINDVSYEEFEKRLKEADREGRVRLALEGIMGNVLTKRLQVIRDLNLETLEIRFPDAWEAVKVKTAREALVMSGLFVASPWKGPKEDLEITVDDGFSRTAYGLQLCADEEARCTGAEAIRILIKSLYTLHDEVRSILRASLVTNPWVAEDKGLTEKLKIILESKLGKKHAGELVCFLWNSKQLKRARRRLSNLLNIIL